MPILYVFAARDLELNIATIADVKAAIPIVPDVPSIYRMSSNDDESAVQIIYGSPDRQHAGVTAFTGNDITREQFDTFAAATDRFLALCQASI